MTSLEAGKRLADRYVLVERLGDGGHAEVWEARDESAGARVALKFLHLRSCSADEALLVLRHEAQMARRLDHPGVLWVEAPQRDGAMVFLPIELAAGGDAARLRGAPWWQVLPVLLQVAHVLEHAHSRGVVHRDIKAGNVLFDASGNVRVTDFGTAARTGCTDALATGSPFSASPQQLRGEAATTADDVYGLGALAYEMLTRHPPYYPDFDAQRVQHENPMRPVPVQPAPPALVDFIVSMLARDARERPDLQQVMQVFEDLVSEATSAAAQDARRVTESTAPVIAAAPRRRHLAVAGWIAVAALLAGLALLLLPRVVATPGVQGQQRADEFEALLATGADALSQGQLRAAGSAYARAAALNPGDPRAVDGQARVAQVNASQRNAQDLAAGVALERGEQWDTAVAHYQTVLSRDGSLLFAQDGQARANRRDLLDRELQDYLQRPERLSAAAVRIAAQRALARADATSPHTPRLGQQIVQLKALLQAPSS